MDAQALATVLKEFSLANQEFFEKILNKNEEVLRSVINGKKSANSTPTFRRFEKNVEKWSIYIQQMHQHFVAHQVKDDVLKRACFLSWIGTETFELIQKLCDNNIENKSFGELLAKLDNHFEEKQHILAARFKFHLIRMKANQSYAEWVAELRGAAKECMFLCTSETCQQSFIDNCIRVMVVIHTPHDKVRSAALQKTNPSLEEVLQIAAIYEATVKTCNEVRGEEISQTVNEVNHSSSKKVKQNRSNIKSRNSVKGGQSCPACGKAHQRNQCYHYKNKTKCRLCTKQGHIAAVCQSAVTGIQQNSNFKIRRQEQNRARDVYSMSDVSFESINANETTEVKSVDSQLSSSKIFVDLNINNEILTFQVDTGATCSLIGLAAYKQLGRPSCGPTNKVLRAYGGAVIFLKGSLRVNVKYGKITRSLEILVVNDEYVTNILGLDLFTVLNFKLQLPVIECYANNPCDSQQSLTASLHELRCQHANIFSSKLGRCTLFKAEIRLKSDAKPKFFKPYNLPFAKREDVRIEIDRLVNIGVLKAIRSSVWAAPIVVVSKPNGKLRICADFRIGVNSQIEIDRYSIPRIEELFYKLQGGQFFTKIDLSEAYLQVELSDATKEFLVINTPFGLFQFQRLPFGIASAPGIFQRLMEEVTAGIPNCAVYLDDIIVTGRNNKEHLNNVFKIFQRLEEYGLTCKSEKCSFAQEQVDYVGHVINVNGLMPTGKRVEAIKLMPRPRNIQEVEAFIGKVNYYNKFIKQFSILAAPLNELRKKNAVFKWTAYHEDAFQALKNAMIKATELVHYDDKKPIVLAVDASKYGIGAVISHRYADGSEKPIAYASKKLNSSQERYSQIEKEALAIIYGVTKFHQYLYGRRFELITDHQALTTLFNPNRKLPVMALHRLRRWAIVLQAYEYIIRFKSSSQNANADALSRLPCGDDIQFDRKEVVMLDDVDTVYQNAVDYLPVNAT
ncbi:uncharacterized protein K02A2.6-like [Teleopsis dalmanni]|uniref:uncharacterized protein K02A2.6-like n=1 Tax=Teleopsis dalmanni TaxID=139649 RepID=UPI0018CF075A|nr:uncharacterized protein K02A2.6-like [Teleopsis dalmanni]